MTTVATVASAIFEIDNAPIPLTAHIAYNSADPVAVHFTFVLELEMETGEIIHDRQRWVIARDLIDAAMSNPDFSQGEGDARITYIGEHQILKLALLDTENQSHVVLIDADTLPEFMAETFRLAPAGQEVVDVDSMLEHLLRGDDA